MKVVPSLEQAQRLKRYSKDRRLSGSIVEEILSEEKQKHRSISLGSGKHKKYFPSSYSQKQMEDTIIELLDRWSKSQQK